MPRRWAFWAFLPENAEIRRKIIDRPNGIGQTGVAMADNAPCFPLNSFRPPAFGGNGAKEMRRKTRSNKDVNRAPHEIAVDHVGLGEAGAIDYVKMIAREKRYQRDVYCTPSIPGPRVERVRKR